MDQYTPPNILFYSKQCQHCKKFAELLFKLPHVNDKFIKISVDVRSQRLPSFVQRVPTIVVFDKGQRQVFADSKVFGWINQYLEKASKVDLVAYDQGGMSSSLSDEFSFIGEEEGKEAEHTFAWTDNMQNTRIGLTADTSSGPTTSSQNSKISENQIERYMADRNMSVPQTQKPQQEIDFTKLYEQESGKGQYDQSVVSQLQQFRHRQIRKGAPPRNAPDFQSGGFKAQLSGQSRRGGIVGGFGASGQIKVNPKQQEMDSRMDKLMDQRTRENSSFQQKQQGEYMPLSFDQQQHMKRQQSERISHMSSQKDSFGMGRRPPNNMIHRVV